jgi:hypothetical protein
MSTLTRAWIIAVANDSSGPPRYDDALGLFGLVKYTVHQSCSKAVGELGVTVFGKLPLETQAEVIRMKIKMGSVILIMEMPY